MKASYQEQIASVPNCTEGRGGSLYSFGEKLPPRESSYMSVTKKDSPHNANFSNLPDPPPLSLTTTIKRCGVGFLSLMGNKKHRYFDNLYDIFTSYNSIFIT